MYAKKEYRHVTVEFINYYLFMITFDLIRIKNIRVKFFYTEVILWLILLIRTSFKRNGIAS